MTVGTWTRMRAGGTRPEAGIFGAGDIIITDHGIAVTKLGTLQERPHVL